MLYGHVARQNTKGSGHTGVFFVLFFLTMACKLTYNANRYECFRTADADHDELQGRVRFPTGGNDICQVREPHKVRPIR